MVEWTETDSKDARDIMKMIPGAVIATRRGCGELIVSAYVNHPDEMLYPDGRWTEKQPLRTYVTQEVVNVPVNPLLIPAMPCGTCIALKDIAEGTGNKNETF